MNIYSEYVYPEKLISPINGYVCRKITKQNIKQFGFETIEQLLIAYPGFPTHCADLRTKHKKNYNHPYRTKVEHTMEKFISDMPICKNCQKPLSYEKRSSNFCGRSCSATYNNIGRVVTEYTIQKANKTREKNKHKHNYYRGRGHNNSRYIDGRWCNNKCIQCGQFSGNRKTCSEKCLADRRSTVARQNAAKLSNRSADEIKLFTLCTERFECLPNYIIDSGWDADIVIPSHKLAILWNGPWHYKDMNMSNHSLSQVQTRDRIKTKLFESLGWTVLVYEDRIYTPETAFEHILNVVAGMGTAPI